MQGNPINPGPQRRLAVKATHPPENLHEDFLGEVGGICAVLNGARQQRVNWLVVARDQPRESLLGAGLQFRNQSCLFGLEGQRTGKIAHGEVRLHISILPPYRIRSKFGISKIRIGPPAQKPGTRVLLRPLPLHGGKVRRKSEIATECAGDGTPA